MAAGVDPGQVHLVEAIAATGRQGGAGGGGKKDRPGVAGGSNILRRGALEVERARVAPAGGADRPAPQAGRRAGEQAHVESRR